MCPCSLDEEQGGGERETAGTRRDLRCKGCLNDECMEGRVRACAHARAVRVYVLFSHERRTARLRAGLYAPYGKERSLAVGRNSPLVLPVASRCNTRGRQREHEWRISLNSSMIEYCKAYTKFTTYRFVIRPRLILLTFRCTCCRACGTAALQKSSHVSDEGGGWNKKHLSSPGVAAAYSPGKLSTLFEEHCRDADGTKSPAVLESRHTCPHIGIFLAATRFSAPLLCSFA
jgi:hypothetical protein